MGFMEKLKETLGSQFLSSRTENGALGYRSTGRKLLDLNFAVSSLRNLPDSEVAARFAEAYYEDERLAVKWLFYAADVREGLGERRLFRICLRFLANRRPKTAQVLLPLIPEYTRWDNLLCLLNTDLEEAVVTLIKEQLTKDMEQLGAGKPISLCAKWMPSNNASSKKTRQQAGILTKHMHLTERQYRKLLSALRNPLNLVETAMSRKEWGMIQYEQVPSRANLIYNKAFLRNDEERRRAFLAGLSKGESKIHAGVLYPHDIVHQYMNWTDAYRYLKSSETLAADNRIDPGLEELWKALPDMVGQNGATLCVADGSGSMCSPVGRTQIRCLDVANALAIYFSEHCSGQFKDKYITFSENPQFVDFSKAQSLREKLDIALHYNEVANTNIEAVFDLVLTTARRNHLPQEELPDNILILSDMEFDSATRSFSYNKTNFRTPKPALFEEIRQRFLAENYRMPKLIFWNICSRTGTIPLTENPCGVILVSGFSVNVMKMVLSGEMDPYRCLLEQLNVERYRPVEEALEQIQR